MTQVLKNKKGVTLVELLAVIVIMGIIAAIAVPAIGGLIKNAEEKAVIGNLTSLTEAARMYASANNSTTEVTVTGAQIETAGYITLPDDVGYENVSFKIENGIITDYPTSAVITGDGAGTYTWAASGWTKTS